MQIQTRRIGALEKLRTFGVNYRWAAGGVICTGRTVIVGKNRQDAERRFFNEHRHVQRVER